eukprot:scaffold3852_cov71-Cyclotella_meneghiniana.AAC.5
MAHNTRGLPIADNDKTPRPWRPISAITDHCLDATQSSSRLFKAYYLQPLLSHQHSHKYCLHLHRHFYIILSLLQYENVNQKQ